MSVPLALSLIFTVAGSVLMLPWWWRSPAFFRKPLEVFEEEPETT